MSQFVFVFVVLFAVTLWLMYRKHHNLALQARSQLLNGCDKVIDIEQRRQDAAGFSHISGRFAGTPVAYKLEVDNLTARKLPVMWLHITMLRPRKGSSSLDMLVRPQTSDVFSPGWAWQRMVTPLKSWPQHARYVSRDRAPELQLIDSDVRSIFADQHAKALLIQPDSVRLTYMVRQADRGNYLLLRSAEFDLVPIDSAEIAALTRQLHRLLINLDGEVHDEAA